MEVTDTQTDFEDVLAESMEELFGEALRRHSAEILAQPTTFEKLAAENPTVFLLEQNAQHQAQIVVDRYIYRGTASLEDVTKALTEYVQFAKANKISQEIQDARGRKYTLEARAYMHYLWMRSRDADNMIPKNLTRKRFDLAADVWQVAYSQPIWNYYKEFITQETVEELLPMVELESAFDRMGFMRLSLRLR